MLARRAYDAVDPRYVRSKFGTQHVDFWATYEIASFKRRILKKGRFALSYRIYCDSHVRPSRPSLSAASCDTVSARLSRSWKSVLREMPRTSLLLHFTAFRCYGVWIWSRGSVSWGERGRIDRTHRVVAANKATHHHSLRSGV